MRSFPRHRFPHQRLGIQSAVAFAGSPGSVRSTSSLASFRAPGEQTAWMVPLQDPGPSRPLARVPMSRPSVANIQNWSADGMSVPLRSPSQARAETARIPRHQGFQSVNNINPSVCAADPGSACLCKGLWGPIHSPARLRQTV